MIQRIQSVYLLIAALIMIVFLFVPIFQFNNTLGIFEYNVFGVTMLGTPSGNISPEIAECMKTTIHTITTLVLNAAIGLAACIAIFMYVKRKIQIKICVIAIILIVIDYVDIVFSAFKIKETLSATSMEIQPYIVLPLCALILLSISIFYIKKDDKLVRSYDRIR